MMMMMMMMSCVVRFDLGPEAGVRIRPWRCQLLSLL